MNILVACEESQTVCNEFRKLGHNAYSCDIVECSGGHPEWHIRQDVLPLLNGKCYFVTEDGIRHYIQDRWDMIIAHPPCTFLATPGSQWLYHPDDKNLPYDERRPHPKFPNRRIEREMAVKFFMEFVNADCDKIAIENPIGCISTLYRKPDQIIHPWMFGDNAEKATCLWLKGLPSLQHKVFVKPYIECYEWVSKNGKKKRQNKWYANALFNTKTPEERRRLRSKTFPSIARAMAEQWSNL